MQTWIRDSPTQPMAERWLRTDLTTRSATSAGFSCSQKRSTSHPLSSKTAVVSTSLLRFLSSLASQYSLFVVGIVERSGHRANSNRR